MIVLVTNKSIMRLKFLIMLFLNFDLMKKEVIRRSNHFRNFDLMKSDKII